MGKLKALLLTQGMHGMISQVEGMAKALSLDMVIYIYFNILFIHNIFVY